MSQNNFNQIEEAIKNALEIVTEERVALIYYSTAPKIVCNDIEEYNCYKFDDTKRLWYKLGLHEIGITLINTVKLCVNESKNKKIKKLKDREDDDDDDSKLEAINKIKKRYERLETSLERKKMHNDAAAMFCGMVFDRDFTNKLNLDKDHVDFKNGRVNLKDGSFEERIFSDYVTSDFCLDYDYKQESDTGITAKIREYIYHTCNDNKDDYDINMRWLGYCLTGHQMEEQKFVFHLGSGGNGKTALLDRFKNAFPCYCHNIGSEYFDKGFSKRHKYALGGDRKRLWIQEEPSDMHKLDVPCIKAHIGNETIQFDQLHGYTNTINLFCKINICTNKRPIFDTDGGIERRAMINEYKNRFVDEDSYKKLSKNEKKGVYVRNDKMLEEAKQYEYKISFFHLLLPYSINWYKQGLGNLQKWMTTFKELAEENDVVAGFIKNHLIHTEEDSDRIHKDRLLAYFRARTGLRYYSWPSLLNELKRLNITYDGKKKVYNKAGCIVGYRINEEDDDNDDNDDLLKQPKIKSKKESNKKIKTKPKMIIKEDNDSDSDNEDPYSL